MKIKADTVAISQKNVLQWRKDFERLTQIAKTTPASDNYKDTQKAWSKLNTMFSTYENNLEQWIETQLFQAPMKNMGGIQSRKVKPLFEEFTNASYNMLRSAEPNIVFNFGWSGEAYSLWHSSGPQYTGSKNQDRAIEIVDQTPEAIKYFSTIFSNMDFKHVLEKSNKLFNAIRDYVATQGTGDKGKKVLTKDVAIHPEYQVFGFTFINKAMLTTDLFQSVVTHIKPHMERLKKFIPEIMYGEVLLLPSEGPPISFKDGSGDSKAAAQYWHNDKIAVFCKDYYAIPDSLGTIMVHEVGHRYYRRKMDASTRAKWGEFFKKGSPASKYGSTDPEEDFCESLAAYIGEKTGKPLPTGYQFFLSQDVFDKLEAIVGRRLTAQVENFYGDFTGAVKNNSLLQLKKGNEFDLAYEKNRKEFWITKNNEPIWRSGTAGYSAIVREWNSRVKPSFTIIEQWLTDQLKDKENKETLPPWQNLDIMKVGATVIWSSKRHA